MFEAPTVRKEIQWLSMQEGLEDWEKKWDDAH
jgi:hypothetical protein